MNQELVGALVQLAISLGGSALLVKLLTLRQDRRKIAGDASQGEANAAATLSGAALQIVQDAESRAREANAGRIRAEDLLREVREENRVAWNDLWETTTALQWEAHDARERTEVLEAELRRHGIAPPPPAPASRGKQNTAPPDARPLPTIPLINDGRELPGAT